MIIEMEKAGVELYKGELCGKYVFRRGSASLEVWTDLDTYFCNNCTVCVNLSSGTVKEENCSRHKIHSVDSQEIGKGGTSI